MFKHFVPGRMSGALILALTASTLVVTGCEIASGDGEEPRVTVVPLTSREARAISSPTQPPPTVPPLPSATPVPPLPPSPVPPAVVPQPPTPTVAPPPSGTAELAGVSVWTHGDSTSYFMSYWVMEGVRARGGVAVQDAADYKISSGLMNPEFFDWPAFLKWEMARTNPQVVVLMFGGNDAVGAPDPAVYARRVGEVMDLLSDRTVIWVGQPTFGRPDLAANVGSVNAVFRQEAARRSWVRYIDAFTLTSDGAGNYTSMLIDETGAPVLARDADGVHFTSAGGKILAGAVLYSLVAAH